jgi:hypothetical protein
MYCIHILKRKLGTSANARSYSYIIVVLCSCCTKASVYDLIAKAIETITSPEKTKYICDNWLKILLF